MKLYLKNFIPYCRASWRLVQQLRAQQNYINNHLEPILRHATQQNDGSLDPNDFKKIRDYYALFVVAIVGENYCRLRGSKMLEKERKTLTFQGALTGLYDDFFDKEKWNGKAILEMMNEPYLYQAKDSAEKLFIHFLQEVHSEIENRTDFDILFNQIYAIQIETKKQIQSTLSPSELKTISEKKGGLSHLFYRITLSNALIEGESEALYELGSLLQQVNDIFDIWKDQKAGIATFASASTKMKNTKAEFELQLNKVYELIRSLNYSASAKRDFFLQLMILIGMGVVSLNQYIALQEKKNSIFNAAEFTRKELVCDMQKKRNLLKLMRVCLSYDFRF